MPESPRGLAAFRKLINFGLEVGHMDGPPIEHRAAISRPTDERERGLADWAKVYRTVMGDEEEPVAVATEDASVLRRAEARGALGHGVEHRLDVRGGAADHPQDLGHRCLLLERLFRLIEQAHVLDGDDRLVGEALEKLDLALRERPHHHPGDTNDSDTHTVADHRHEENATEALFLLRRDESKLGCDIGGVHDP